MGRSVHSSLIYGVTLGDKDDYQDWASVIGLDDDITQRELHDHLSAFAESQGLEITIASDDEYPTFIINIPGVGFESNGISELNLPETWEIDSNRQDQVKALKEIAKKLDSKVSWILTATLYV